MRSFKIVTFHQLLLGGLSYGCWDLHAANMGEMINEYAILIRKFEDIGGKNKL
jgi:hypothetical protein